MAGMYRLHQFFYLCASYAYVPVLWRDYVTEDMDVPVSGLLINHKANRYNKASVYSASLFSLDYPIIKLKSISLAYYILSVIVITLLTRHTHERLRT